MIYYEENNLSINPVSSYFILYHLIFENIFFIYTLKKKNKVIKIGKKSKNMIIKKTINF
jgi:hypothetical protein